MARTPETQKIILKSSDNQQFEVDKIVALESLTIKHMIENDIIAIPLPNVTGKILAKVIDYCKKHVDANNNGDDDDDLKDWDTEFVNVDQNTLFDLIVAANYLNIESLLVLTCQTVVDMIKEKTEEEIRETFNNRNAITTEEEEEVRTVYQWALN